MENKRRLNNEQLVFGIVGSEYVAEKQTVVTKSAGGVACSVNLQLSQKCAIVGWRQNVSAHSNGVYLFTRARPIWSACLLTYTCNTLRGRFKEFLYATTCDAAQLATPLECSNELSAYLAVRHSDVTLPSVPTTH